MFKRIIPFIFLGVMLVLFAVGMILFSYLLILGAIVGVVLFLIAWLKEKFFPNRALRKTSRQGETLDHNDAHKK